MTPMTQETIADIDLFAGLPRDDASWDETREMVASTNADRQPVDAAVPSDEEDIVSEVTIRSRMIEWLVGFLPREASGV